MIEPAPLQPGPDELTAALDAAGMLAGGRVVGVEIVHAFDTLMSRFHRLRLRYAGGAEGPRHVYLKTGRPDQPAAARDSGRREVAFYATVAPATPAGLLPRCLSARIDDAGAWAVTLEDLTDTHAVATQWPLPPTFAQSEAMVRCRARFHASWWDHARLGDGVGAWPTAADTDSWLARLVGQYADFADALGDRLPPARRALYEALFTRAPGWTRVGGRRGLTIVQGDAHVWNCFLPRDAAVDTPLLFDWDAWRIDVGAEDIAYMIALHWFPDMRASMEGRLLDAYHDQLLDGGVAGYDRRALRDDYRLSVLWLTTRPIWMRAAGIPPSIWWNHLERIHLAVDDLGCRELLG